MAESRSPLKDKPLRNPGQSVHEQRVDLVFDKLMAPLSIALLTLLLALVDWIHYYRPRTNQPWLSSALAGAALIYAGWKFWRYLPGIRMLRLAESGEKAVGQFLERLRESGYAVFHDLVGTDFNVDHVIIGPAGVFTIETKTWNKPGTGNPRISFDGETLRVAGREPDRNPVIQAKAQASWLQRLLAESTGKTFTVRPVVLFPGWYVEDNRSRRKDLWVLEPKALSPFLANEPSVVSPQDVKLASFHLSRFIRAQELALEEAS